jgi:hypothetical protein
MTSPTSAAPLPHPGASGAAGTTLMERLNTTWHERGLYVFSAIVLGHWCEHLFQAVQVYVMHWPVPKAGGALGLVFPWLVKSEVMHYGYALIMLVCFWIFRTGFVGRARTWWMVAFWIQFWHHIEHALLFGQAAFGHNLFGRPVPTSIAQLFFPRLELHLFYNTVVFIPMVVAMYYHLVPSPEERSQFQCSCAVHPDVGGAGLLRAIAPWVGFVVVVATAAIWAIARPMAMPGMTH